VFARLELTAFTPGSGFMPEPVNAVNQARVKFFSRTQHRTLIPIKKFIVKSFDRIIPSKKIIII